MKSIYLILTLAAIYFAANKRWIENQTDEVVKLTKDNFESFITDNKYVFVKFFAPWCGHCKSMAPSYIQLATRMNEKEDGIPITEVDATENTELAAKYGVEGYPALKLFIDGKPIEYSGERDGEAIENFINKKMNPAAKELTKIEELRELETVKLAVVLVTATNDPEQLAAFNTFTTAYEISFYIASFEGALAASGATGKFNLVVYRNFDEGKKILSSDTLISSEEMKTYFDSVRHPTVLDFDQEAAEKIFGSEETSIFLFTNDATNDAVTIFNEVAKERKGDLTFSKSTIKEGLGERLSEYLGITDDDNNSVRIIRFNEGNVIKYKLASFNKEQLLQFIDDFKANKLTAYFKSDPLPETNSEPVKVIVGNSFDDLVINNDKWVLLEVYAPWCGHCKKLAPIYDELALKLAAHEDIVVAKMDGTTNEHSLVVIKGFPALKFFRKGDKQNPIDFEGDRTLDGFLAFIEKEIGIKVIQEEDKSKEQVDESL